MNALWSTCEWLKFHKNTHVDEHFHKILKIAKLPKKRYSASSQRCASVVVVESVRIINSRRNSQSQCERPTIKTRKLARRYFSIYASSWFRVRFSGFELFDLESRLGAVIKVREQSDKRTKNWRTNENISSDTLSVRRVNLNLLAFVFHRTLCKEPGTTWKLCASLWRCWLRLPLPALILTRPLTCSWTFSRSSCRRRLLQSVWIITPDLRHRRPEFCQKFCIRSFGSRTLTTFPSTRIRNSQL